MKNDKEAAGTSHKSLIFSPEKKTFFPLFRNENLKKSLQTNRKKQH